MQKKMVKRSTIIAIIILALGLIYAVAVVIASAKLRRAYEDLSRAGRPIDRGDVIPARIPNTENAAPLYESAILLLEAQPILKERWQNRLAPKENLLAYLGDLSETFMHGDLPPDKHDELQELIRQDSVALAMSIVEQAAQRHSCRFDHDYDAGICLHLTHLSKMRQLARILAAAVCLEARAGSHESAWNRIPTQLKLADGLLNEPVIVSQLVRIRMIELACQTVRKLCEIAPPTERQSRDIAGLLKDFDDVRPLVRAIDGERLLLGEWVYNLPKRRLLKEEDIVGSSFGFFKIVKIYFKPTLLADRATYLRIMLEFAQRFERPHSQEGMLALDRLAETESERYPLASVLTPAMNRVKIIYSAMLAELRIVRTGLALLQYKQSEGTFPDTLETLKLSNANDPFSSEPLRYKPQAEGFVLYSVGSDLEDNDGNPKQDGQGDHWDIVWQFPGIEVPKVESD